MHCAELPPGNGVLLVFALKDESDELFMCIHPQWQHIVMHEDSAYIRELLSDLKQRAEDAPVDVFKQLSTLSVGPLIARGTGLLESINPFLCNQCNEFISLD